MKKYKSLSLALFRGILTTIIYCVLCALVITRPVLNDRITSETVAEEEEFAFRGSWICRSFVLVNSGE